MTTTPNSQARARELLRQHDGNMPEAFGGGLRAALATELRAALDRETAALAEVERLKVTDQRADMLTMSKDAFEQAILDSARRGIDLGVEQTIAQMPQFAFTGRQTGRNRADIPSDAGVPTRDVKQSLTTEWPDESRIDVIGSNGGDHAHTSRGDEQGAGE